MFVAGNVNRTKFTSVSVAIKTKNPHIKTFSTLKKKNSGIFSFKNTLCRPLTVADSYSPIASKPRYCMHI